MSSLRRSTRKKRPPPQLYVPVLKSKTAQQLQPPVSYGFFNKQQIGQDQFVLMIEKILNLNQGICESIASHYILNSGVDGADALVVAKQGKQFVGFSLLQLRDSDSVYIDVICTEKGHGALLVHQIIQWTAKIGRQYVELSALPHVINFYRKIGFGLTDKQQCEEKSNVKKVADKVAELHFKTTESSHRHKQFQALLDLLIEEELVAKKSCTNIVECSEHGYHMTYCIDINK